MLSSNSCGEVYEIAGKLISIRLPQNNKSTITRCGALLKIQWICIKILNSFLLDLLNTRTQHAGHGKHNLNNSFYQDLIKWITKQLGIK